LLEAHCRRSSKIQNVNAIGVGTVVM
jgi:hypothetical protein